MPLEELLQTSLEKIIPERQEMIVVDSKEPVPQAFKTLVINNIWSAPVFDYQKREFTGFIDMLDIVTFIVKIFEDQARKESRRLSSSSDLYTLLEQVEHFDLKYVEQLTDISKRNPMCPIRSKDSLFQALKIFNSLGVHRLPILSSPWHISNVLTQSAVISWLFQHCDQLGPFGKLAVKDLEIGIKPVISISETSSAIQAFKLMTSHRITSIALINSNGTLSSILSAKDIKIIEPDALFTKLYKPVSEFLQIGTVNHTAISCGMQTRISEVIQKLAQDKIHRIYIINQQNQPIGVITLGDILKEIYKYYTQNIENRAE